MNTIPCPHCKAMVPLVLVQNDICPSCMADIRSPNFTPPPPPPPILPPGSDSSPLPFIPLTEPTVAEFAVPTSPPETHSSAPDRPRTTIRRRHHDDNKWLVFILVGAAVGAAGFIFIGLLSSQFAPVFGGFMEKSLAVPFSPARLSLIPVHVFVFAIVGTVLGGAFGALICSAQPK